MMTKPKSKKLTFLAAIVALTFLLIGSLIIVLIIIPSKKASYSASNHNASGWAWSATIGWISFNCIDISCVSSDYGVNIDPATGNFSGYAWSENIGWIDFAPVGGFPAAPNYSACVDIPGASTELCNGIGDWKVAGWAKAIAADGNGWDGWIKLGDGGTWPGGGSQVWLNTSVSPYQFRGWAWGSDVVGWISFNCADRGVCGSSNYRVITDINFPPSVNCNDAEGWDYCTDSRVPTLFWVYNDPDEGDSQESFWIQIDDGDFSVPADIEIDTGERFSSGTSYHPSSTEASNLNWGTTYNWRVKVKDTAGNWSDWSSPTCSFDTPLHAYPNCRIGDVLPANPSAGENVRIFDDSTCFDDDIDGSPCTAAPVCGSGNDTLVWSFTHLDGSGTVNVDPDDVCPFGRDEVVVSFSDPGQWRVDLTVTDSSDPPFICSADPKTIYVEEPLPEWKEIIPR